MKRLISICLTAVLIALTALTLTGCGKDAVSVTSELTISDAFRGSRIITVKYPLSAEIDAVKDAIIADNPAAGTEGVSFTYRGVEEDGYYFELALDFNDREDYEREVAAVIGRTASSFLSRKDTVLTQGIRMTENFSVEDLIAWIVRATEAESSTSGSDFSYDVNTVTIGGDTYSTGSAINISEVRGSTVNSVTIRTSNDKEGHFDRTFEFSVPNSDYVVAKEAYEQYFLANTAPAAKYYGWTAEGASQIYKVIFEGLTLRDLKQYTSMLLDTDSVSVYYGDMDNTSTPLSEGLAFEETLDTFSFIGPDKGAPALYYSYSLPTSTIHGDGAVFSDGKWNPAGEWKDGVYQLELSTGSMQLRVPDGIQYAIDGIDFYLESLGGERFRRTTNFLYSKRDGRGGRDYAVSFFTGKGAKAQADENDSCYICSVVCEGTTVEMTAELVRLFGSGNFMAYRKNSGAFALTTKTTFTDYISLGSILNSANASRPMHYYFSASGVENIVSVMVDGSETAYISSDESCVTLKDGAGTVEYYGVIPITSHIVIYVLVGLLLLGGTIFGVVMMLRRKKARSGGDALEVGGVSADGDDDTLASLTQTTTFSIAELGALSRNKRYVDEINKDIEERIESDRLDRRKREIRQKELEEMERKVYGEGGHSPLDEVPELNIDALRIEDDEPAEAPAPRRTAAEPQPQPAPEPAAQPADPFSLLDDRVDEDDDV